MIITNVPLINTDINDIVQFLLLKLTIFMTNWLTVNYQLDSEVIIAINSVLHSSLQAFCTVALYF